MPNGNVHPDEGDILIFWHNPAQKQKFAINLEPRRMHKYKKTFNAVLTTTQKVDTLYPTDHKLPDGTLDEPTKVLCGQPIAVEKGMVSHKIGRVSQKDLGEIRKRVAPSLGIPYSDTTL